MEEENIIDLELRALDFILKARREKGISETELGKRAFPQAENPRAKINAMFKMKTGKGNNLRLRLGDFCALCKALDLDPPQEIFNLWHSGKKD